jgi:hypothetical protein
VPLVAAKKNAKGKGRLLSESKVKRVLESMDVDTAKFLRLYAEDVTRTKRGSKPPTDAQIAAVRQWMKDHDSAALRKSLKTGSTTTMDAVIRRVLEHA